MNDQSRNRQPKGIPTGGQFAASARSESDAVSLSPVDAKVSADPWGDEPAQPEPIAEHTPDGPALSAAEFASAVKADQALRALDPGQEITLPDGSRVEVIADPDTLDENGEVATGIVEEGTFAITRPDGSTGVRGFYDLGERGQVSQQMAFDAVRDARDTAAAEAKPFAEDPAEEMLSALGGLPGGSDEQHPDFDAHDVFPPGTVRDGNGTALGPDGTLYKDDPSSIFHGAEIISQYTRAQALADGVLKNSLADGTDLSSLAREAGIPVPVAFTAEAFRDAVAWPESNAGSQDETGRAWDALWMASRPIKARAMKNNGSLQVGDRIPFTFIRVPNTPRAQVPRKTEMHAVFGVDDMGQPCFTFMMPNQD